MDDRFSRDRVHPTGAPGRRGYGRLDLAPILSGRARFVHRGTPSEMRLRNVVVLGLLAWSSAGRAQDRQLVIPQDEGERQGRIIGRAIACGVAADRTNRALQTVREQMLRAVGRALTDERFVPVLNQALFLETNLPRPSEGACAEALEALARLEAADR